MMAEREWPDGMFHYYGLVKTLTWGSIITRGREKDEYGTQWIGAIHVKEE